MQQLGKSLKDISIDKIYVGMKIAFKNAAINSDTCVYGKVINVKKNTPQSFNISGEGVISYGLLNNGITMDFDNGPVVSRLHSDCDFIYYAE